MTNSVTNSMITPAQHVQTDWDQIGQRIMRDADALALYTETAPLITRTYLTPQHRAAAMQLAQWMIDAGMTVRGDAAAM
jgi:hypothetical protein